MEHFKNRPHDRMQNKPQHIQENSHHIKHFLSPQGTENGNLSQGKTQKHSNLWKLNSMLLNNEQVKNEINEEIKKLLKTNENENTTIQNLWDTAKAALRGSFIVIQAYLKMIETFQINNTTSIRTG